MKKTFLLFTLIIIFIAAYSQEKNKLTGTWYLKEYADNNARPDIQQYSSQPVKNSRKILIVSGDSKYTLTVKYNDGTTEITNGTVVITNDQLDLRRNYRNKKGEQLDLHETYAFYAGNATDLIISYYPTDEVSVMDDEEMFTKEETDPPYTLNQPVFQRIIYETLLKKIPHSAEKLKVYTFTIVTDAAGNIDLSGIRTHNADTVLLQAVTEAMRTVKTFFKPPAGKGFKAGIMNFSVTY